MGMCEKHLAHTQQGQVNAPQAVPCISNTCMEQPLPVPPRSLPTCPPSRFPSGWRGYL